MKKLKTIGKVIIITMVTLFGGVRLALAQLGDIKDIELISGDIEIGDIIENIGTWILTIAGGIAILFLIYGGVVYITGGEKGAESGKKIIVNAIIGIIIIALAAVIVNAVMGAITG